MIVSGFIFTLRMVDDTASPVGIPRLGVDEPRGKQTGDEQPPVTNTEAGDHAERAGRRPDDPVDLDVRYGLHLFAGLYSTKLQS